MAFIDLTRGGSGHELSAGVFDVCIVGSGPAGCSIFEELTGTGRRVVMLESGGLERLPQSDTLNEIENIGRRRAPQWVVRNRILGGSSHSWGGRCGVFDEIDFEPRSWVPESGWPFSLADLAPYLRRSAAHLGLAFGTDYGDERFWALAGRPAPARAPDPDKLLTYFWQFSRDHEESYPFEYRRFGRSLPNRLQANMTLVTGATVVEINTVESGEAVRGVTFATPENERHQLAASIVVLCTGGIENARILLSSTERSPAGLGNGHDLVGRHLMDHLRGPAGFFDVKGSRDLQRLYGRYNVRNHFFRAGLRLSPKIQRQERLLNCAAWLGEEWAPDDPWQAFRNLMARRASAADFKILAKNADILLMSINEYFVRRNGIIRKLDELSLVCMVEQLPDPDSRVTLSDRRDRLGMRLARVDWRAHEAESRTMRRMAQLVAEEFKQLGHPDLTLADWVRDGAPAPDDFVDVAHPTGTTKMSSDPAKGVVDAQCQVHGVAGLYVMGSSVFPTAGHCNPTAMIVAMAIRMADLIKDKTLPATAVQSSRILVE